MTAGAFVIFLILTNTLTLNLNARRRMLSAVFMTLLALLRFATTIRYQSKQGAVSVKTHKAGTGIQVLGIC